MKSREQSSRVNGNKWSPLKVFFVLFIAGTILRIAVIFALRHVPFVSDARDYVDVAHRLLSGQRFVPYWPPGLPLYLTPFVALGGSAAVLRASMLFFWVLACWAIWRLASGLGLERYAWLPLAVFVVMPASIQLSVEPLTQLPVAALLLVALGAAVTAIVSRAKRQWDTTLLLGISLGWMALLRPSALPLVLLVPALCGAVSRRWKHACLAAVLGMAMVIGWLAEVHHLCNAWMINSANSVNLYYGNNPWTPMYRTWYFGSWAKIGSPEIARFPEYEQIVTRTFALPPLAAEAEFKRMAVTYILHHPWIFALRSVNRFRCYWGFDTFTSANLRKAGPIGHKLFPLSLAAEAGAYLAIALPAFFWIAAAPAAFWRTWRSWLLAGALLVYSLPYWFSMSHPTYHFPVIMPLAFLGLAAWRFAENVRHSTRVSHSSRRGWSAVVLLLLIQLEWAAYLFHSNG
ncbi:MAG TPA: hypothetical protein VMF56_06800 [Acidobacteriaceae bacterium]|nr:hypothetical protein [Acidobacteriaceae bacterium]